MTIWLLDYLYKDCNDNLVRLPCSLMIGPFPVKLYSNDFQKVYALNVDCMYIILCNKELDIQNEINNYLICVCIYLICLTTF